MRTHRYDQTQLNDTLCAQSLRDDRLSMSGKYVDCPRCIQKLNAAARAAELLLSFRRWDLKDDGQHTYARVKFFGFWTPFVQLLPSISADEVVKACGLVDLDTPS